MTTRDRATRAGRWAAALLTALACLGVAGGAHATQTITYLYDAIGRLTSATYDGTLSIIYEYDPNGNIVRVEVASGVTGVGPTSDGGILPATFALGSSVPNPFAGRTTIAYQIPVATRVSLAVFEASGRRVRRLLDGIQQAGYHFAYWDGSGDSGERVAPGLYFFRIEAGAFRDSRKVVLLN